MYFQGWRLLRCSPKRNAECSRGGGSVIRPPDGAAIGKPDAVAVTARSDDGVASFPGSNASRYSQG